MCDDVFLNVIIWVVGVPFLRPYIMMMEFKDCNIISWNVRGAVNKRGQRHVRELVWKFSPMVFILLETHITFKKVRRF